MNLRRIPKGGCGSRLVGALLALWLTVMTGGLDAAPLVGEPYFLSGPFRTAAALYRQGDAMAAAEAFAAAWRTPAGRQLRQTEAGRRAGYLHGLALAQAGRWAEAAAVMEALSDDDVLGPYVHYQRARCQLRAGQSEAALASSRLVPRDGVLGAEASLITIDLLGARRLWRETEEEARRFLADFPSGPRQHEAAFARAVALSELGRVEEAAPLYRRVASEAPTESWRGRAETRLRELGGRVPAALLVKTAEELQSRGMALFQANQNEAAEAVFAEVLQSKAVSPAVACQAQFHLAQSVMKARQRGRAAPEFEKAEALCRAAFDDDFEARSRYQRGRCLINTGEHDAARAVFVALEEKHPQHRLADDARLRAAEAATEAGALDEADALLASLPGRYPTGDMVGEAIWRRALRAFSDGRWAQVRSLLDQNLRLVPLAKVWYAEGRAEYWQGRTYELERDRLNAVAWYEKAIRRYPLSVYALLAWERLRGVAPRTVQRLLRELRSDLPMLPRLGPLEHARLLRRPGVQRAIELARLGLGADAHRELARVARELGEETPGAATEAMIEELTWVSAFLLDQAGLWNPAHALMQDKLVSFRRSWPKGAAASRWLVAYPAAFGDLVLAECKANDVSAALQFALMREESAFNPRAVSTANCHGLTMLKTDTAGDRLGRPVTREALWDPATNLKAGSRQLAWLLKRYRGTVPLVIASYNGGITPVDRWLGERGQLPLDQFLETIPYDETRNYTKRVLASFFAYAWLTDRRQPVPRLDLGPLRP